MISKETFFKALDFIKARREAEDRINDAYYTEFNCSPFLAYSKYEAAYIDLLCDAMSDGYDATCDISYFIYDLEFGEKYTYGCVTEEDGTVVDCSTADALYDYIADQNRKAANG